MNTEPVIKLEHVCKSFPSGEARVEVLHDVNLTINTGEFVSVMGASGSGKTTLLNLMGGLLQADSGEVQVAGKKLMTLNDHDLTLFRRRELGFVFQMFNLIPGLTVEENLLLPSLAAGGGWGAEERRACAEMLERVGLQGKGRRFPRSLSGGEQQRATIARALMHHPRLVLADEPTGNLDSETTQEIGELFRSLHRDLGVSLVLVTHEPSVALWGKRLVLLRDGCVAAETSTEKLGSPAEVSSFCQSVFQREKP